MPFFKQNDLLIDPVARTVVPRKQSPSIVERDHYVKVGNALMQVPESTVRTLAHHASKTGRAPPKVITHRYTVRLACCAITMEDTRYKELNAAFIKQYSDVGRGRRALGFPLMSFWDIKSEVEPQSISPSVAIWLSSWMGRTMGGTTWH